MVLNPGEVSPPAAEARDYRVQSRLPTCSFPVGKREAEADAGLKYFRAAAVVIF